MDYIPQILKDCGDIIKQKNHDYDNAFDKACDMFTDTYAASKIYEKTMRIVTLSKEKEHVKGEGLEDALMDCIGYCTLYLNRIHNKNNGR